MADKKTNIEIEDAEIVVQRAKGFWDKYSKSITFVGAAIILVVGGLYGYQKFVQEPREKNASEMIFPAENLFGKMANTGFNKDSVNIVINGGTLEGNNITGLLKVISKFGGSHAANRANYMTGACYLHIGEFDKAIKYLKEFNGNGATQIEGRANVLLGHAYAEKNNKSEALKHYKKAASVNEEDEAFSSDALYLAATYAAAIGDSKEANALFEKLKDKFPGSSVVTSGEADKNLARMGVIKNN